MRLVKHAVHLVKKSITHVQILKARYLKVCTSAEETFKQRVSFNCIYTTAASCSVADPDSTGWAFKGCFCATDNIPQILQQNPHW